MQITAQEEKLIFQSSLEARKSCADERGKGVSYRSLKEKYLCFPLPPLL